LAAAAAAVLVGVVGSTAFACANLATLSLSVPAARPGSTVMVTGTSFAVPRARDAAITPVVVHWQSRQGEVLAEVVPDRTGMIATTFAVPHAAPGTYVIVATQQSPRPAAAAPPGAPVPVYDELGTPALASFQVLGPGQVYVAPSEARLEPVSSASDFDSSTWLVLMVTFGAVAVSLFAGGLIAFVYQARQPKPAPRAWVPDGWW
jgi:hypothetical protein